MPFVIPENERISGGFSVPESERIAPSTKEIKSKIYSPGSHYKPTFREWQQLDAEPTDYSKLPGVFLKAGIETIKGVKKSVAEAAQEAGRRSAQPEEGSFAGNLASTGKEYAGRALSYLGGLARPVVNNAALLLARDLSPEERQQAKYLNYLDKLKTQRFTEGLSQDTTPAFSSGHPFVKVADFGAQVLDPTLIVGAAEGVARAGLRQLGKGVAASTGKSLVENAIENAAKAGARTTGEKIAGATGKAVEKAGAAAQAAGAAPRKIIKEVAEKVVGPDLAGKAAGIVEGTAVLHNPIAKGVLALEGLGAGAKKLGQFVQRLAETPATGPFGRFVNLAKGDAPEWMRRLANSVLVKAGKEVAPYVGSVVKGGAHGAAVGAGLGIMSGDSPEEITSKAGGFGAFGAGFGVLHGSTAKRAKVFEQRIGGLAELVKDNLDAGVSPDTLKKIPDSAMLAAADIPSLGIKDKQGRNLQIRFLDSSSMPEAQKSADGFYSPDDHIIYLNSDNLKASRKGFQGSFSSVFHELAHPLFESEVSNQPQIKADIDKTLLKNGLTLSDAKYSYAKSLLVRGLEDRGVTDPVSVDQAIRNWVLEQDEKYAAVNGDPNHWIYSELLSEAGRNALGLSQLSNTPEGAILEGVAAASLLGVVEKLGVKFRPGTKPGTIIPGFENVVADPSLRRTVYKLLKKQRDYRPGITPQKEQGTQLTSADIGTAKAPFHPTGDGRAVNPYGMQVASSDGKTKFVPWTRRQMRKMAKTEKVALAKYIQPGQRVTSLPDEFYRDPDINPWTKAAAKQFEQAVVGNVALEGWYHRLNSKNSSETGDWKSDATRTLGNTEVSYQEFLPMALFRSKAGNTLADVFSLSALQQKATQWAGREGSLSLERWGGNPDAFLKDVQLYNSNHAQGLPGDANNLGVDKRNVINAFLFGRNKEFEVNNPLRASLKGPDRQGIVRSLRLDRLETLQPHNTDLARPDYEQGKRNFSPESPEADEFRPALRGSQGEIIPGNKGDIHNDVIGRQSMDWRLDNMEPERGFVDNAGNFHSREQVSAALGERLPMQSERLRELQAQGAPDKLAQSVVEQAAVEHANFSPHADKFIDNDKSDIKNKRVKKNVLPNAVGDEKIPVIHLSSNNNLKKVDPKFFGKGRANRNDTRGGNKSYFFVEGSSLAGDTYIFGQGGYNAYRAEIPGSKLYDLRKGKPDTLGYFREINREAADDMLQDAGYDGVLVETGDGRKVVMAFKPVKVEPAGDFKGSVAKVKKANRRQFSPESEAKVTKREPNEEVRSVAAGYMEQAGLPYKPVSQKVPVNAELAKQIADFYEDARHEPENPAVKASYNAFAKETVDQWNYITSQGVKMEPWKEKGQPYKDSAELLQDVRENKHLWFFPTEGGFGSNEGPGVHPLLENSGIAVNGEALPVNDVFRAVHDYFGHAKDGNEFGPKGELNAFLSHSRMYSDAARPAMAAETLGQNSWVNYGRHLRDEAGKIPARGEKGFVPLQDRPFADQKATVLPDELVNKVSQFSPATESGKELEKQGFEFKVEDYGAGGWQFDLTKDGKSIGYLSAKQTAPDRASVDMVTVTPEYRAQGVSETLYRELASLLQRQGITHLDGTAVHPAPLRVREKLFGAPEEMKDLSKSNSGHIAQAVTSRIDPNVQFSPESEKEKAPVFYSQLEKVVDQKFSGKQMPAAQLAAILRNPNHGVKADELKWSGLDDFLKGKQRVTKEEVQQFLQDNRLGIKEVVKGGPVSAKPVQNDDGSWHVAIDGQPVNHRGRALTGDISRLDFDEADQISAEINARGPNTKFEQYQLPGGENYREILFQLPGKTKQLNLQEYYQTRFQSRFGGRRMEEISPADREMVRRTWDSISDTPQANGQPSVFNSNHWDELNVLAHTRVNDREDAQGRPGLLVEEIQSDWHQRGRKQGYKGASKNEQPTVREDANVWVVYFPDGRAVDVSKKEVATGEKAITAATKIRERNPFAGFITPDTKVPDAPFKNTWHEFVFRRLVRMAAEEGKDWIGWTTGEQQAERYDLSKQVSSVKATNLDGNNFIVQATPHDTVEKINETVSKEKLADLVGKDLAEKIIADNPKQGQHKLYTGLDLKVGGEGMKGFYDKILVDYANKFGKKFGARVEENQLPVGNSLAVSGEDVMNWKNVPAQEQERFWKALSNKERNTLFSAYRKAHRNLVVHSLPITPEMKKSALQEGVSLFSPSSDSSVTSESTALSRRGKTLEKLGFSVEHQTPNDSDTPYYRISISKNGETAAELLYWFPVESGKNAMAEISSIETMPAYRRQGLATALYHELGATLQQRGVKRVAGDVLSTVPMDIRKKVFGKIVSTADSIRNFDETEARDRLPKTPPEDMNYGGPRVYVENRVNPRKQFSPMNEVIGEDTPVKDFVKLMSQRDDLIASLQMPEEGWRVKDIQGSRWHSIYWIVENPEGETFKLRIANHDATRTTHGPNDFEGQTPKEYTLAQFSEQMRRAEAWLRDQAGLDTESRQGDKEAWQANLIKSENGETGETGQRGIPKKPRPTETSFGNQKKANLLPHVEPSGLMPTENAGGREKNLRQFSPASDDKILKESFGRGNNDRVNESNEAAPSSQKSSPPGGHLAEALPKTEVGRIHHEIGYSSGEYEGSHLLDQYESRHGVLAVNSGEGGFPMVNWVASSKKGEGRSLFLGALKAMKDSGRDGLMLSNAAEPEAMGALKSLERRGFAKLKEIFSEHRPDEGYLNNRYIQYEAEITEKGETFLKENNPSGVSSRRVGNQGKAENISYVDVSTKPITSKADLRNPPQSPNPVNPSFNPSRGENAAQFSPSGNDVFGAEFVSSNVGENIPLKVALRRLRTKKHRDFKKTVDNIDSDFGVIAKSASAVGDWIDGAEDSLYRSVYKVPSVEAWMAGLAKKGLTADQKAVLGFRVHSGGPDRFYEITVPRDKAKLSDLRKVLSQNGLDFRTIVPQSDSLKVVVVDFGGALEKSVNATAKFYGIKAKDYEGTATFVGDASDKPSRQKARREYRRLLRGFKK
jgi:ribosomal protein S18 acetylase RimI-like enzyme